MRVTYWLMVFFLLYQTEQIRVPFIVFLIILIYGVRVGHCVFKFQQVK